MKKHLVTGFLGLYAIGWIGAAVQGVLLSIGPKGISADAFLWAGFCAVIIAVTAGLGWAHHRERRYAAFVAAACFALIAVGGMMLGFVITIMGIAGATDSYVLPIGLLLLVAGGVHATAAWLAWSGRPGVDPID